MWIVKFLMICSQKIFENNAQRRWIECAMNKTNRTVSVEVPCLAKPLMNVLKPKKFRSFSLAPSWAVVMVNSCKSKKRGIRESSEPNWSKQRASVSRLVNWWRGNHAPRWPHYFRIHNATQRNCLSNTFKDSRILKDRWYCTEKRIVQVSRNWPSSIAIPYYRSEYSRPKSSSNDDNLQVPYKFLIVSEQIRDWSARNIYAGESFPRIVSLTGFWWSTPVMGT